MMYCSDNGLSSPYCARKAAIRSFPSCGAASPAINLIGSPGTRRGKKKLMEMARKNVIPNSSARRLKFFMDCLFLGSMISSDGKGCRIVMSNACEDRSLQETDEESRGWQGSS